MFVWILFLAPAAASVKGFDEDSVASLSTTQDETQDSHVAENGITNSSSHPFQGGYMLAASYWPKVDYMQSIYLFCTWLMCHDMNCLSSEAIVNTTNPNLVKCIIC